MQALMKMLSSINNTPTVSTNEEDVIADSDEPPDHLLKLHQFPKDSRYPKSPLMPPNARRESLLTRAMHSDSIYDNAHPTAKLHASRGLSTASSHSAASMASTAELTSDASPTRSCTPSPPIPSGFTGLPREATAKRLPSSVVIAPITKDDRLPLADDGEAALEKTLGRKRCIMFACGGSTTPEPKEEKPKEEPKPDPPKRKCALTFICPSRQESTQDSILDVPKQRDTTRSSSPPAKTDRVESLVPKPTTEAVEAPTPLSPQTFHEFGSSHDETDTWVNDVSQHVQKLTLSDCMKKEMAIRKLGEEAEEEAEQEERDEAEQMDDSDDDQPQQDDFAPSDSDDGNESDDEGGFADSDDESDAGSDYQFWAPTARSTTTLATSQDNLSHISNRGRSRASSLESNHSNSPAHSKERPIFAKRRSKTTRMRPGTPELPDSTDFVCGTLDEDRPLEAAYISCIEQRKRQRHVPIPQDIDPSFPTSDPEDEDDDDIEDSPGAGGPAWMQDSMDHFEMTSHSKTPIATRTSTPPSPRNEFPFPRPQISRRSTNKSPPPACRAKSPPPNGLFAKRGETVMRSPPHARLRSPPGSPRFAGLQTPMEIGQRPFGARGRRERTASLPRTPNPFFKHFNVGSPSISNVASGAVTPAIEDPPRPDRHVRGPVDIVMGLERKRQKRKEKFWRQHCRKVAQQNAGRRTVPGRGAERMKELGLECAERTRGYGIPAQGTQLVISL
jgi:hypothetical protein